MVRFNTIMIIVIMIMMALLVIINMIRYLVTKSKSALYQQLFYFFALCVGFCCWHYKRSIDNVAYYNTCIEKNYTVYLNENEVEHPDKLNVKGYDITFDDEKKKVLLSD